MNNANRQADFQPGRQSGKRLSRKVQRWADGEVGKYISKKKYLAFCHPTLTVCDRDSGAYNVNSSSECVCLGSFSLEGKRLCVMCPDSEGSGKTHWTLPFCAQMYSTTPSAATPQILYS